MMAPSRELLQALGADLQLPPAWRALAARAHATVERRWLVARIARPLLVATPAGASIGTAPTPACCCSRPPGASNTVAGCVWPLGRSRNAC